MKVVEEEEEEAEEAEAEEEEEENSKHTQHREAGVSASHRSGLPRKRQTYKRQRCWAGRRERPQHGIRLIDSRTRAQPRSRQSEPVFTEMQEQLGVRRVIKGQPKPDDRQES